MVNIAFHFNAPNALSYACRLLRKAYVAGNTVAVLGDAAFLKKLDEQLWTFSALDFVPHVSPNGDAAHDQLSPIWLCESAEQAVGQQILINFSAQVPPNFEQFERVIEVVTQLDADRAAARLRWKHYTERGFEIIRHDLNLQS